MKKVIVIVTTLLFLISCTTDRSMSNNDFQTEFNELAKDNTAIVTAKNGKVSAMQNLSYDGKNFICRNQDKADTLKLDSLSYIDLNKVNRNKVGIEYGLSFFAFCIGVGFIAENAQSEFHDLDIGGFVIGLICAPCGYVIGYLIGENIRYEIGDDDVPDVKNNQSSN